MRLYDVHNHLQDGRFDSCRGEVISEMVGAGVSRAVVNGTREDDWGNVAALAAEHCWVIPSFGLHPWHVKGRSGRWLDVLAEQLASHPGAVIGEVGLDRWIKGFDLKEQSTVFTAQLDLAVRRNLPITIHCLKAWGALWEMIRSVPLPSCGFLLHAYSGPSEMVRGFEERGAYFSFSTYFLHERKTSQRDVFRAIPLERVLVETDAPDMAPPSDKGKIIVNGESGDLLNHPANLAPAYRALAQLRGVELEVLVEQVEQNFLRLFGER